MFEELFTHQLITRRRFQKHVGVSYVYEFLYHNSPCFPQHTYASLTKRFQDSSVIKLFGLLTLLPSEELVRFTRTHLAYVIMRYVWDFSYLVTIPSCIVVMRVP